MTWQKLEDRREKYRAYLASREWAEKRDAVIQRANGVCERCQLSKVEEVHHLTYERLYDEPLDDLQGLCSSCHQFVGNHSDYDPAGLSAFRTPPRNLDAEKALIASMLLSNEVVDDVIGIVSSDSFYGDTNRRISDVIFTLHKRGTTGIDAVTVTEELSRRSELDHVGVPYLMQILDTPLSVTNAVEYAKIVRSKAALRTVIYELSRIVDRAYVADEEQVISEAESAVFTLSDHRKLCDVRHIGDTLTDMFHEVDKRINEPGESGVSSGFTDLDEHTTGFQPGELIILAARPSMGKTALATNFIQPTLTTLFFSLEQSNVELSERLIVRESLVNSHDLRAGSLTADQREQLMAASEKLSRMPIFIDDSPTRRVTEMRSIARRIARKEGLDVIIIDYLQLIQPEDNRIPREQQVAQITRQLKCLAKELRVPVIALSQLNRGVELREDKRPRLADLRESGAIEQDADMVLFLHRPDAYDPEDRPGEAEVIVAKHRNGPTGIIRLTWRKHFLRFDNYEPPSDTAFDNL